MAQAEPFGRRGFGVTARRDRWWIQPLLVFAGLSTFIVYATWAAFQGRHYTFGPYLSPFYSPELFGDSPHAWFGPKPGWWPGWAPFSPALLILWAPGGFRLTCYYYRGAYYKAFWADPPACAVAEPRSGYRGESSFPLIMMNIHRFFLNAVYSPRHSTIITTALDELTGVDDREAFLAVAREANSEELVLFYQHVAEMMRGYHLHIGAVDRLLALPRVPALYTRNGTLVVMLPVDYVFWTSRVARVAQALTGQVPTRPRVARRELWIAGNVSPRARQEFEALGWTVYEQVSARLNPPA